jgi:hypothetical protein
MNCRGTLSGRKRPEPNSIYELCTDAFGALPSRETTFTRPPSRSTGRARRGLIFQYHCRCDITISLAA